MDVEQEKPKRGLLGSPRPTNRVGRPSNYSHDIAVAVCEHIANGMTLAQISKLPGMPRMHLIFRWLANDQQFRQIYDRAQIERAEKLADEILDIADNGANDWMDNNDPKNPGYKFNQEHWQRSKLRVETRKWIASKMLPKKYGDHSSFEISGTTRQVTEIVLVAPESNEKAVN